MSNTQPPVSQAGGFFSVRRWAQIAEIPLPSQEPPNCWSDLSSLLRALREPNDRVARARNSRQGTPLAAGQERARIPLFPSTEKTMAALSLKPQEIPLTSPGSGWMFEPTDEKPFVATPAAIAAFGVDTIVACLGRLQQKAREYQGLDYLQAFEDQATNDRLWFIEDGPGGAITALLPSDY